MYGDENFDDGSCHNENGENLRIGSNNKSIKPGLARVTTGVATATVATAGEETT